MEHTDYKRTYID